MGVKDGFMGASTMMKVALILLIVANLFNWIAFTTTSWGYINSATARYPGYGLWRLCAESGACSRLDGTRSGECVKNVKGHCYAYESSAFVGSIS